MCRFVSVGHEQVSFRDSVGSEVRLRGLDPIREKKRKDSPV